MIGALFKPMKNCYKFCTIVYEYLPTDPHEKEGQLLRAKKVLKNDRNKHMRSQF